MVGGSRAVVALALGGWLMGSAAWAAEKTVVVRGTATPGGGFPVYGAAVADILNETDPTLAVQTRNTKGSTENVPLLEAGQLDLALVQGEVVHEALTGVGRSPANLVILAAMYSRQACSSSAPTARTARSPTSAASPSPSGHGALGSSFSPATSSTASGSIRSATSRPSTSTAPATAPPWCSTGAWRRSAAAASAGPGSAQSRRGPRARGFSHPTPTGSGASWRHTRFSSR